MSRHHKFQRHPYCGKKIMPTCRALFTTAAAAVTDSAYALSVQGGRDHSDVASEPLCAGGPCGDPGFPAAGDARAALALQEGS